MTARRPVTEETREQVRRLHAEGLSRNAIAKAIGFSGATVTKIAQGLGLSFDRSKTAAAVKAHAIDLAAERIVLAEEMAAEARRGLALVRGPVKVFNFGGKDNTFNEVVMESAPLSMRREAVTLAGIAFDKLSRIVERDAGGSEEAVGMLDTLAEGFKAAAERYRAGEAETDEAR